MRPKLQVALDFTDFKEAEDVARAVKDYVDFMEAGTPLIKSEGISSVRKLSLSFPSKKVVADMKTMDTGFLEAKLAFENLADYVSVLAAASDETIKGARKAAEDYGKGIMVDLISVNDPIKRISEIEAFEPDYIVIHSGIDEQGAGKRPFDFFNKVKESFPHLKVAVAGGINEECLKFMGARPELVIVGSFITRSKNPVVAAKRMRKALWRL